MRKYCIPDQKVVDKSDENQLNPQNQGTQITQRAESVEDDYSSYNFLENINLLNTMNQQFLTTLRSANLPVDSLNARSSKVHNRSRTLIAKKIVSQTVLRKDILDHNHADHGRLDKEIDFKKEKIIKRLSINLKGKYQSLKPKGASLPKQDKKQFMSMASRDNNQHDNPLSIQVPVQQERYKTAYRKIEFTNIFRKANSVYEKDNKRKALKYKKQ